MNDRPQILIAQDIEYSILTAQEVEQLGFDVYCVAHSVRQALKQAEKEECDLLIMDARLDGQGIQAGREIRQKHAIPVLYVASQADQETLEECPKGDSFGVLVRPYSLQQLRAAIETALHRHCSELSEKYRAMSHMASEMAHHLNNILTVVSGNAQLLLARGPDDWEQHRGLNEILSASRHAAKLVGRMMTYGQCSQFTRRTVDLHHIVRLAASEVARRTKKSIKLQLDLCQHDLTIEGDPSQLLDSLLQLTDNACEAMDNRGVLTLETRMVDVDARKATHGHHQLMPGRYACLFVRDNGTGMDRHTLKRAMEPFFTTKLSRNSAGLGLAAVLGCVNSHKGDVSIKSKPGTGTTVCLHIPLETVESPVMQTVVAEEFASVREESKAACMEGR